MIFQTFPFKHAGINLNNHLMRILCFYCEHLHKITAYSNNPNHFMYLFIIISLPPSHLFPFFFSIKCAHVSLFHNLFFILKCKWVRNNTNSQCDRKIFAIVSVSVYRFDARVRFSSTGENFLFPTSQRSTNDDLSFSLFFCET